MNKMWVSGGFFLLAAGFAAAQNCTNLNLTVQMGSPGFTSDASGGIYNPAAVGALNEQIASCGDTNMVVVFNYEAGTPLRLTSPIKITGRTGKTTVLRGAGPGNAPVILTESGTIPGGSAFLLEVSTPATIDNFEFNRKVLNSASPSVLLTATGSIVTGCHFVRALETNTQLPSASLIEIQGNEILVQRSTFRNAANRLSRSLAITVPSGSFGTDVEIRSNLFLGTSVYLAGGTPNLFANTFVGGMDAFSPVTFGVGISTANAVAMQHNLFANRVDTLPPVRFESTSLNTANGIFRNGFSSSAANPVLARNNGGAVVLLNDPGSLQNTLLGRGFSHYGPSASTLRDFPLVQMATDSTLAPTHADFGKIPIIYQGYPSSFPDIANFDQANLKFTSVPFLPLVAGQTWSTNSGIKLGCFVSIDPARRPTPLAAGDINTSLAFRVDSTDRTRILSTSVKFSETYYGPNLSVPSTVDFYFADAAGKLESDDPAVLEAIVGTNRIQTAYSEDFTLSVPQGVRTGGAVFVKMLHSNAVGRAPVISATSALAQVTGIPAFPINDLSIAYNAASTATVAVLTVTRGTEPITQIRVSAYNAAGFQVASQDSAAGTGTKNFIFSGLPFGEYTFKAFPIATVGTTPVVGEPTAATAARQFGTGSDSSVQYVQWRAATCPTDTLSHQGTFADPHCFLDSARVKLAATGGTIIVRRTSDPFMSQTLGGNDTTLIILESEKEGEVFADPRPIFRGGATSALTINRKNVVVRGFLIEVPATATVPAVAIGAAATGVSLAANIFRPQTKALAPTSAVSVAGQANLISNVIWGFANGIAVGNGSSLIQILNNTFIRDPELTGEATALTTSSPTVGATIANNFFSGYETPYGANFAGKEPVLEANAYTEAMVEMRGLTELGGGLDRAEALATLNLTGTGYKETLSDTLLPSTGCNIFTPCSPLLAGGAITAAGNPKYYTGKLIDVFGNTRVNRPEVGALEYTGSSIVPARLRVFAEGTGPNNARFSITGLNFDTAQAERIVAFWSDAETLDTTSSSVQGIIAFPIADILNGDLQGTIGGLEPETDYWFQVRAFSNDDGGYVHTIPFRTTVLVVDSGTCDFATRRTCPESGSFGDPSRRFISQIVLPEGVSGGQTDAPRYSPVDTLRSGDIRPYTDIPMIRLNTAHPELGVEGSDVFFTYQVELPLNAGVENQELFVLAEGTGGLPRYWPHWKVTTDNVTGTTTISVKVTEPGPVDLVFGKLPEAPASPVTAPVVAEAVFDFTIAEAEQIISVPVQIAGLKTSNPVLIATLVPAGGAVGTRPFKGAAYHNRSFLITQGLKNLGETLAYDRALDLYQRVAKAASSLQPFGPNERQPLVLWDSMSTAAEAKRFLDAQSLELSVGAGGALGATLELPVNESFKEVNASSIKVSRSQEIILTLFDGGNVSRTRTYMRTHFGAGDVHVTEGRQLDERQWHLFALPWEEAPSADLKHLVNHEVFSDKLHRVLQYTGSGEGEAAFLKHDGTNGTSFEVGSGQALWVANVNRFRPVPSSGLSLDYQAFELPLAAGVWNDIGLPFNFPILWSDVRDSSGAGTAALVLYEHQAMELQPGKTVAGGGWVRVEDADTLRPWVGYTVKPATDLTLRFPVLDTARSLGSALAKTTAEGWDARVRAYNQSGFSEIRIGSRNWASKYAPAPLVPGQDFSWVLVEEGEALGESIRADQGDGMGAWQVRLASATGADPVRLRLQRMRGNQPLWWVETTTQSLQPIAAGEDLEIAPALAKQGDFHLVAGDEAFARQVLAGLSPRTPLAFSNFPNPFSGMTRLRYGMPYAFRSVDYRVTILNMKGQRVWEKSISGGPELDLVWDGRSTSGRVLPSGQYTALLEAKVPGKPLFTAKRKIVKIR